MLDHPFIKLSRLNHIILVLAFTFRFSSTLRLKSKKLRALGPLSVKEINFARISLLLRCQRDAYHDKIHDVAANRSVRKDLPLLPLTPFLDENGLLRVVLTSPIPLWSSSTHHSPGSVCFDHHYCATSPPRSWTCFCRPDITRGPSTILETERTLDDSAYS